LATSGSGFEFDIVAQFFFIWAILSSVYLTIFVDTKPELAIKGLAMAMMLIAGLFGGMRLGLLKKSENIMKTSRIITLGLFAAVLTILVQYPAIVLVPGASFTVSFMFYLIVGVAEESFFRGFLATWFYKNLSMAFRNITVILMVSMVFTAYHLAVYGTQQSALLAVFLSSLVLTGAFIFTRRLGVSIVAHVLLNFVASGGPISGSIFMLTSLLGGI